MKKKAYLKKILANVEEISDEGVTQLEEICAEVKKFSKELNEQRHLLLKSMMQPHDDADD